MPICKVDQVYDDFKHDFFPGENILVILGDDGNREPGLIRGKTRFPEVLRPDGSVHRPACVRYDVSLNNRPDEQKPVDTERLVRERKTFTKQRLRSFFRRTIDHEGWAGAPWCVKPQVAGQYQINCEIPPHLTQENQALRRKVNLALKKSSDFEGQSLLNFHSGLPLLKPKGLNGKRWSQDYARLSEEYQRALAANPELSSLSQAAQQQQFQQFVSDPNGFPLVNRLPNLAVKSQHKPPPPPPPPKYPIEDLELTPIRDKPTRPALRFLSTDTTPTKQVSDESGNAIMMRSVGPLLETWDTLNVYCEVFQLDSFTFDDFVEALQLQDDVYQCQLLVEVHCAVLMKLVNDVNDKNGSVQISLPEPNLPASEESSIANDSAPSSPMSETDAKPSARTTRSSLAKTEAAELKNARKAGQALTVHRATEMDQSTRPYDWKTRLRRRDFSDGNWVYIIVGLLNQLSNNPRRRSDCDAVLSKLAPLDEEPTVQTAILQYTMLDINTRVKILELLCMLSLDTKAIRSYMEDCTNNMTEHRKERIDFQRKRKAALEDLRLLHEERKVLQPESKTASPVPALDGHPETDGFSDSKMLVDTDDDVDADDDGDVVMDTEDEEPHQGRSLRRANDRAAQRKQRLEEEKLRKERIQAEKAKKPSKQEKRYEKVLKLIEEAKDQIREYEEEMLVAENDLREADCPRTRVLGKDRFWNRYYWFERNAMPYAGLPTSSTAFAGYANGRLWVQGPDEIERQGFIDLCKEENDQYHRAFRMTVPQRKLIEEGDTHVFHAREWGFYDEPDQLDQLIGWLDSHGVREIKLRKELQAQRDKISQYMVARKDFLESNGGKKSENGEPASRVSTRTKSYVAPAATHRCFTWSNSTAERENGHIHSEPKAAATTRKQAKAAKKFVEDEGRQTRATNRQGKPLTRQGSRYIF
ncbi:MAG: hypothetical protein Q9183_000481 [Haloplaca sp. 2 TL-2023]